VRLRRQRARASVLPPGKQRAAVKKRRARKRGVGTGAISALSQEELCVPKVRANLPVEVRHWCVCHSDRLCPDRRIVPHSSRRA